MTLLYDGFCLIFRDYRIYCYIFRNEINLDCHTVELARRTFDSNRKMGDNEVLWFKSHERSVTAFKTWFYAPCIRPQQFSFLLEARTVSDSAQVIRVV